MGWQISLWLRLQVAVDYGILKQSYEWKMGGGSGSFYSVHKFPLSIPQDNKNKRSWRQTGKEGDVFGKNTGTVVRSVQIFWDSLYDVGTCRC